MGTGEKAAKAPLEDYIMGEETDLGTTFTIPIEALNKEIELTAFSKRKKKWYDRLVLVDASTLPSSAIRFMVPDYNRIESAIELYDQENKTNTREELEKRAAKKKKKVKSGESDGATEPADIDMKDGTYSIEVNMTGGSGRASVSSPTWLIVEEGRAYARLLWSSSYYDYMIVDEVRYDNLTTDGSNSTFKIPITAMDDEITVVADTTAMGDPVEIEYHLTFYSGTIDDKDAIPQEAAIKVLVIAIVVIVVGGVLNYVLKKRRKR